MESTTICNLEQFNDHIIINKYEFDKLKKMFSRSSKTSNSKKYKTLFPALRFYGKTQGIDAIRYQVFQKCKSFFCIKKSYSNKKRIKKYTIICIYPNKAEAING